MGRHPEAKDYICRADGDSHDWKWATRATSFRAAAAAMREATGIGPFEVEMQVPGNLGETHRIAWCDNVECMAAIDLDEDPRRWRDVGPDRFLCGDCATRADHRERLQAEADAKGDGITPGRTGPEVESKGFGFDMMCSGCGRTIRHGEGAGISKMGTFCTDCIDAHNARVTAANAIREPARVAHPSPGFYEFEGRRFLVEPKGLVAEIRLREGSEDWNSAVMRRIDHLPAGVEPSVGVHPRWALSMFYSMEVRFGRKMTIASCRPENRGIPEPTEADRLIELAEEYFAREEERTAAEQAAGEAERARLDAFQELVNQLRPKVPMPNQVVVFGPFVFYSDGRNEVHLRRAGSI